MQNFRKNMTDKSHIPIDRTLPQPQAFAGSVGPACKQVVIGVKDHAVKMFVSPNVSAVRLLPTSASPGHAARGYAIVVRGSAPVAKLIDDNFGRATLAFPVVGAVGDTGDENVFHIVDEDGVVSAFAAAPMFEAYPGVSAGLYRTQDGLDKQYVVVVRGNDRVGTREALAGHATSTIDEFYKSPEYRAAMDKSKALVTAAARHWAQSLGLRLADEPTVETRSFVFKHDKKASAAPIGSGDKARNVYVFYNDVTDASQANGGVLLDTGALGGFVELRAPPSQDGEGRRTHRWANDKCNMVPTSTGPHQAGCQRRCAFHASQNDRLKKAAAERVKWDGPVVGYNGEAERRLNAVDGKADEWIKALAGDADLERRAYETVVVQPAGVNPAGLSLKDLMFVSRGSPTVELRNTEPVFAKIVNSWHRIWPNVDGYTENDLQRIFARPRDGGTKYDVDRGVLEAVSVL